MKSVAIGWIAHVQSIILISICLAIAFALLIAGIKFRKKGYRFTIPFVLTAALVSWYPFWGYFPGMLLAKNLCDDIGGVRTYASLPVTSKSILFATPYGLTAEKIAELLVGQGFESVDESFWPESTSGPYDHETWKREFFTKGGILSYSLSNNNSPDCDNFRNAVAKDFGLAIAAYQHGVRHNQCIAIKQISHSKAQVVNKTDSNFKRFPIGTEIVRAGYYDALTHKPIVEQSSFYYYASNPYAGPTPKLACNWTAPYRFTEKYPTIVTGTDRHYPKASFKPQVEEKYLQKASVHATDLGTNEYLDLNTVSKMRQSVLGLDQHEARIWRDAPSTSGKADALIIEMDSKEEAIILPPYLTQPTEKYRGSSIAVHALATKGANHIVIRGDPKGKRWEILTFSVPNRSLTIENVSLEALLKASGRQGPYALFNNNIFLTELNVSEDAYRLAGYVAANVSDDHPTRVFGKVTFDIPR